MKGAVKTNGKQSREENVKAIVKCVCENNKESLGKYIYLLHGSLTAANGDATVQHYPNH